MVKKSSKIDGVNFFKNSKMPLATVVAIGVVIVLAIAYFGLYLNNNTNTVPDNGNCGINPYGPPCYIPRN